MELFNQEQEFVAGHKSGNEQLGNNSWETRGACKQITAAHQWADYLLLCCAGHQEITLVYICRLIFNDA